MAFSKKRNNDVDEVAISKISRRVKGIAAKRRRKNAKSREELKALYGVKTIEKISVDEALDRMFNGCDDEELEDDIDIESWLLAKFEEQGLLDEFFYASCIDGDAVLKFLKIYGFEGRGGYKDNRVS